MVDEGTVNAHIEALADKKRPIYRVFARPEVAALAPEARRDLARIAEVVVAEELAVGPQVWGTFDAVLGRPDAPALLAGLAAALLAADGQRRALRTLLDGAGDWATSLGGRAPAFFGSLDRFVAALSDLGPDGVLELSRTLPEDEAAFAARLDRCAVWGDTGGEIVKAAFRIVALAERAERTDYFERLQTAVPSRAIFDDKDAERILPALALLLDAAERLSLGSAAIALELATELAESGPGPAFVACRDLPDRMSSVGSSAANYLEACLLITRGAGVRAVGFLLGALPKMYEKQGEAAARSFAELVAHVGEQYGPTAAQLFWEQRTEASKRAAGANS